MIYEDLIVEHNSTLIVVVVANLKLTSFSLNEFTMNVSWPQQFSTPENYLSCIRPKFGLTYTIYERNAY
jgi:hypothetical protein